MLKGKVQPGRRALLACSLVILSISASTALADDPLAVFGTDGPDTLNGTAAPESFYARAGNDIVKGNGGNDELDGGAGADTLSGGDGVDVVSYTGAAAVTVTLDGVADDGAAGEGDNVGTDVEDVLTGDGADKIAGSDTANTLDGGGGDDRIDGGKGADSLFGGAGDDTVNARDGEADLVDCGDGSDTAIVDRIDVTVACESVEQPPLTASFLLAKAFPRELKIRRIALAGVATKSSVIVTCVGGCGQGSSLSRVIAQTASAHPKGGLVTLRLPASPRVGGGATIEIGVAAPGARRRCIALRFPKRLNKAPKQLKAACRSVAKD